MMYIQSQILQTLAPLARSRSKSKIMRNNHGHSKEVLGTLKGVEAVALKRFCCSTGVVRARARDLWSLLRPLVKARGIVDSRKATG